MIAIAQNKVTPPDAEGPMPYKHSLAKPRPVMAWGRTPFNSLSDLVVALPLVIASSRDGGQRIPCSVPQQRVFVEDIACRLPPSMAEITL